MMKIIYQVKNFFKWGWRCRDIYAYDWAYLLQLMEYQLTDMQHAMEQDKHHYGTDKCAKDIKICKNLCNRLVDNDEYYHIPPKLDISSKEMAFNIYKINYRLKYDLQLLTNILNKKLRKWWT